MEPLFKKTIFKIRSDPSKQLDQNGTDRASEGGTDRVTNRLNSSRRGSFSSLSLDEGSFEGLKNVFVSLKIKKQMYLGRNVVAIYIRDKTKRVHAKL